MLLRKSRRSSASHATRAAPQGMCVRKAFRAREMCWLRVQIAPTTAAVCASWGNTVRRYDSRSGRGACLFFVMRTSVQHYHLVLAFAHTHVRPHAHTYLLRRLIHPPIPAVIAQGSSNIVGKNDATMCGEGSACETPAQQIPCPLGCVLESNVLLHEHYTLALLPCCQRDNENDPHPHLWFRIHPHSHPPSRRHSHLRVQLSLTLIRRAVTTA